MAERGVIYNLLMVVTIVLCAAGMVSTVSEVSAQEVMSSPRKVMIGFAGPLADRMTQSARDGAGLAVQEANQRQLRLQRSQQKIQFELLPQDDKADVNMAAFAAQYFIRSGVIGVIGHWSTGAAIAVAPAYEKQGIPQLMFTASGHQFTASGYQTSFRIPGSSDNTAFYLVESAVKQLQAQRIAVIESDTPVGRVLAAAFVAQLEQRGIKPVARTVVSSKTSDFNEALKQAQEGKADLIFFNANGAQVDVFVQSARRLNTPAKLLLTGGSVNRRFDQGTIGPGGAIYTVEPDVTLEQCPRWKSFQQRYASKYGTPATSFSRYAYDATTTLIEAVRQADSLDTRKILTTLHRGKFKGLNGDISFDKAGNSTNFHYTLYQSGPTAWRSVKVYSSVREPACS